MPNESFVHLMTGQPPAGLKANRPLTAPLLLLAVLWLVLAVTVVIFQASSAPAIEVEWVTATEFNTAGFNLYRADSPDGPWVQLNEVLIPSHSDPASGASYVYVDNAVMPGKTYYYVLEDVEYDNSRERHAPVTGQFTSVAIWTMVIAASSAMISLALFLLAMR
jgi:hypothetical protein